LPSSEYSIIYCTLNNARIDFKWYIAGRIEDVHCGNIPCSEQPTMTICTDSQSVCCAGKRQHKMERKDLE